MLPTKFSVLVSVAGVLALSLAASAKSYPGGTGEGKTTRYWDCCKTSCAWSANTGAVTSPVNTCPNSGLGSISKDAQSGCNGGDAYVCNDQQPFVHEGQLYAFAAGNVNGLPMNQMCCACYKFTFTNTAMAGKNLIVQVINTGSDLGSNHFDIQIPGGGMGIFTAGCAKQWPGTPANKWGQQYGGVSSKGECAGLPEPLRKGCEWRFDHFKNADNPLMKFERVPCPEVLVAKSKCKRQDD